MVSNEWYFGRWHRVSNDLLCLIRSSDIYAWHWLQFEWNTIQVTIRFAYIQRINCQLPLTIAISFQTFSITIYCSSSSLHLNAMDVKFNVEFGMASIQCALSLKCVIYFVSSCSDLEMRSVYTNHFVQLARKYLNDAVTTVINSSNKVTFIGNKTIFFHIKILLCNDDTHALNPFSFHSAHNSWHHCAIFTIDGKRCRRKWNGKTVL